MKRIYFAGIILFLFSVSLYSQSIRTGAERTEIYFHWLKNKNVAVVANQTSLIQKTHLVDSLLNAGINVKKIFCPEHGFRGEAQEGEKVNDSKDRRTGLPLISLYGKHKKPSSDDLEDIDAVVFDLQDVGTRFYTYTSTMSYVMEACAENKITFIVLDRPNPNGFYVDGPVMEAAFVSFVGLFPVPIVHGLTVAEYALMINGEKWLKTKHRLKLKVVGMENYDHSVRCSLPVMPSPNLPNANAVFLYPSLCLFEGTVVSVGRGTDKPFQIFGHPDYPGHDFSFTPHQKSGSSIIPPFNKKTCYGIDLTTYAENHRHTEGKLNLEWLLMMYKQLPDAKNFFTDYFDTLAGNHTLQQQIKEGLSEEKIRESWQPDLNKYKKIRKKYLLYPDFE